MEKLISEKSVANKIYLIRGKKIMLDMDLAEMYQVETKYLTRQVRRNANRFPEDFMFQLTRDEILRCQFGTSSYGGRRYLPYVFTEQGVAMLSSVLHSKRAVQVNIQIMRTFTKLREYLATHENLKRKIEAVERKFSGKFSKHDKEIQSIFHAIRLLMATPAKPKRRIGFHP